MSEMVDRVAKAIDEADDDELLPPLVLGYQKKLARAAIAAMLDMIDEALK